MSFDLYSPVLALDFASNIHVPVTDHNSHVSDFPSLDCPQLARNHA